MYKWDFLSDRVIYFTANILCGKEEEKKQIWDYYYFFSVTDYVESDK